MTESATYVINLKDNFSNPLRGLETKMDGFEKKIGGINSSLAGLGQAFVASAAITGITALTTKIIGLGAEMEQTRVSFETMLGSSEKATTVLNQLTRFAEKTPFRQGEVVQGAKQLLAFGFQSEELTSRLTTLGDVSSGLSIPIGDLIYLFGTLKTQGRAYTKDIMQFAQRGIPIYDELANVFGVTKDKISGLLEDGKVSFSDVDKAFKNMTKQGSMFGGLMDKQSRTLSGRWSTFLDVLENMGRTLGEKMLPSLGKVLDFMSDIVALIPKLNFAPLTSSFSQLSSQISTLFSQFSQLMDLFGTSFSTFDALTVAVRYLSYIFRVAWSPIRGAIFLWTELVTIVKNSVGVFQGIGEIIKGVFTLDWDMVKSGAGRVKDSFGKLGDDMAKIASDTWKKEKEGWQQIFAPISGDQGGATSTWDNSMSGSGKNKGTSVTGNTSAAGVEKIQAGTRNVTLNINTLKLADSIVSNKADLTDVRVQDMLKRALLAAVNDVNIVAQ